MKRIISTLVAIFAISSLAAQLPESPFTVVACPDQDTRNSINISWSVDTLSDATSVRYTRVSDTAWKRARVVEAATHLCTTYDGISSKTPQGKTYNEDARFTKCEATLSGLRPNTDYMYSIGSGDKWSEPRYFRTSGAKEWSACLISDFHAYTPLPHRVDAGMAMISTVEKYDPSIDWVLHLGDITAWGGSYSFWSDLYTRKPFHDYMWAGVNGNHDNMTRVNGQSNAFIRDANFYPRNGYGDEMGVCYYFYYGDALFIMLNNEVMRKDEGLAEAQAWVRKVVEQNKARYVIVCEHYQWFFGHDGKSSQYGRWCELFDELGVDLALAGNNHIYVRTAPLYAGEATDGKRGTVYVQLPSSDNERGQAIKDMPKQNEDKIRATWYEGPQTVGAIHLAADKKHLVLTLLDRNGNEIDKCEVLAKKK